MFNTVTEITNILFKGWNTHTWKDVLFAAVVICAMTLSFEGLKTLKSYIILRRSKRPLTSEEEDESPGFESDVTSMSELVTSALSVAQKIRRKKIMWFLLETMMHVVNLFFGYILMFLVMTYSVWFLLAILLGSGAGFFIFYPISDHLTSKYSSETKSTDHHSGRSNRDRSMSIIASEILEGPIF